MLLPEHKFHKPASLDECLASLKRFSDTATPENERLDKVQVIAGGTDVIYNMRLKFFHPENLISIRRLPELQQVEELDDGSLRIGAACRLVDLADSPLIQSRYPALKQAVDAVASAHIRNLGTLGGNICLETRCWYTNNSEEWRKGRAGCFKTDCEACHVIPSSHSCHAINNADTPPALIALNAMLTIQSASGSREMPIDQFYNRDGIDHMNLGPGELLTHITLPAHAERSIFLKHTPRKGMDFSIAAVAVCCDGTGDDLNNIRIVIGSISSAPIFLDKASRLIEAQGLHDDSIAAAVELIREELGEVTNLYGKATYKKQIAKVLVRRALEQIKAQEKRAGSN